MFLIITSKRIALEIRAKSQIVENSFPLLYLMKLLKIDIDLIKILPLEVNTSPSFFPSFLLLVF